MGRRGRRPASAAGPAPRGAAGAPQHRRRRPIARAPCAQIVWSVVLQWYDVSGGDNGILGVWPASWARARWAYYYVTVGLTTLGLLALRRIVFAPFGYALRAGRDAPLRADAIGLSVRTQQWLAVALAGGFARPARRVFSFRQGRVVPPAARTPPR